MVSCYVQDRHTQKFGGDKHMSNVPQNNMAEWFFFKDYLVANHQHVLFLRYRT